MTTFDIIVIAGGALLILLALVLGLAGSGGERRVTAMRDTPTYTAQDIAKLYRHHGGGFGQPCEVVGVIEADASLTAPVSGQMCVAYSLTNVWEVWKSAPASHGRNYSLELSYHDGGTELDDQCVSAFWVRDATGRVLVEPINATLDLFSTDERYEALSSSTGGERRSTYIEKALLVGQQVYVLGYLTERKGQPIISYHPRDPSRRFLISYRTEQELARSTGGMSNFCYFLAGCSGALGALLLLWQFALARR